MIRLTSLFESESDLITRHGPCRATEKKIATPAQRINHAPQPSTGFGGAFLRFWTAQSMHLQPRTLQRLPPRPYSIAWE